MRKVLVLAFVAFFSLIYTDVWGTTYNYHGAFNSCSAIHKETVAGKTQFTLTMGVRAKNTNGGTNYSSTLTLILLSTDGTLEGTYYANDADDDNKITGSTNLVYSSQTARTPRSGITSTFTIEKIGAPDYGYRVTSGALYLTANSNEYNYTFCYGLDGSGDVDDRETAYYDFKDITYTGTSSNLTLTIGLGAMEDYASGGAPWYGDRSNIKHIIIEDGVTAIGEYAFQGCNVEDITIPVSVKSFGTRAFYSRGTGMSNNYIYYAGTPNEWADIDFTAVDGYPSSHPFYNVTSSKNHIYFYDQTSTETTNIVFTPGLTTIRPYVFWYAGNIENVNIPNSVTSIGKQAFWYCSSLCRVFVNNTTAPTASADAFEHMKSGASASWLYLPNGANSDTGDGGFKKLPWYDSSYSGKGPARVGYQGTDVSGVSAESSFRLSDSKVYPRTGTVDGITWTLDDDGVMTFSGSGAITTTFTGSSGDATYSPWMRWRYLVDKVVITGGITGLSNALDRFDALREVEINQTIIPTSDHIGGTSTTFGSLINTNTSDKIKLTIKSTSTDDTNLLNDPWNNARWERSVVTSCSNFAFWYGTNKTEEDHTLCFTQVGETTTWLTDLWTIPSEDQWTYVGEPFWDNTTGKSANLQLSNMPYALNHANNLGTIGTNVMEGAQGYIKINDDSNDANRYVGFIPAGYVLRWGSANDRSWTSKVFSPASEDIEEEDWNTELHEWTSSNAMDTTFVALKTSDDYVWSNRSETRVSVFFKPNDNWLQKDAESKDCKFAMYYYTSDEAHNGWSAFMTDPDGDGIYEAWIPKDYVYTKVIFVRFPNSKASTGDWTNEYNQTGNLSLLSDKNVFTLAEGKWGTEADEGSWSLYNKKGTFHISANSNTNNWYCHFLPHHVLTFDANGGEGAPEDQSVAINAAPCQLTVSSTEPTRTGYDFVGWATTNDAVSKDDAWDPGDTHAMTGDVTLYAVWSPATLTFNASEDANWNNANNWSPSSLPTINHDVIINKPAVVNTTSAVAKSVIINQSDDNTGKIEIAAGQKLIVAGTIKKTTDGTTYSATEANDIIINSDATHGLGALVIGTHDATNQATVNFTTLSNGTSDSDKSVAQYVGTPFNDETNILYNWYNSWVYGIAYTSNVIGWERVNEGQGMTPFKGYCVFSADGVHHNYWQQGTLVASTNQTLSGLNWQSGEGTANGNNENLLANSWMAPIKINAMEASDFTNTEATIYIFNSTSASDYEKGGFASNYTEYTPGTAEDDDIIPSMQSFSVFTNTSGGSVSLDYNKIVYLPALDGTLPGPNHVPRRDAAEEANKIRLFVHAESGYGDLLYMWERSDFSEDFENGWDGHKLFGESVAPQLFALSPDGNLAISCIPTFEGVQMGFKAGEQDNNYTFTFEYSDEAQPLYLLDVKENTYTQITGATSYSFTTTDTDVHNRFVLTYNAPSAPTAIETTPAATTGKKVMYDNHLYILRNGRIFSAQGAMIQ